MTAQEQGLAILVQVAREIVPPPLDFVIIVYRADGSLDMSSVTVRRHGKTSQQSFERAKEAATAFITEPPRASFHADKN